MSTQSEYDKWLVGLERVARERCRSLILKEQSYLYWADKLDTAEEFLAIYNQHGLFSIQEWIQPTFQCIPDSHYGRCGQVIWEGE